MNIKRFLKEEKGSVMLEFCLVLPIYLLLFGGTFLMFDIMMGRVHLQEANRNIAWLQDDRYDFDKNIDLAVYKSAVGYFETRNNLEYTMRSAPMWWSENSDAIKFINDKKDAETCPPLPKWGHLINEFDDFGKKGMRGALKTNYSLLGAVLEAIPLFSSVDWFKNDYLEMRSGNMALDMSQVSGVYIGALAVSSSARVNKSQSAGDLYRAAYTLTRAKVSVGRDDGSPEPFVCACCGFSYHTYNVEDNKPLGQECQVRPATVNNEMLVLRRKGDDSMHDKSYNLNIFGGYKNYLMWTLRDWPVGDSVLDDLQLFFGFKLGVPQ